MQTRDKDDSPQTLWHFIVYKTMAPGGRNTIVMLSAANTEGKRLAGKSTLMLPEGPESSKLPHLVSVFYNHTALTSLPFIKEEARAPSQAESDETVQWAPSSREMCHIPSPVFRSLTLCFTIEGMDAGC